LRIFLPEVKLEKRGCSKRPTSSTSNGSIFIVAATSYTQPVQVDDVEPSLWDISAEKVRSGKRPI
jgi:hypothetical protein